MSDLLRDLYDRPPKFDGVPVERMVCNDLNGCFVISARAEIDGASGTATAKIDTSTLLSAKSVIDVVERAISESGMGAVLSARRRLWEPWEEMLIAGAV